MNLHELTHEPQKEILKITNELFYHHLISPDGMEFGKRLISSPQEKLFGFSGRATLQQRMPYSDGLNLVVRIPLSIQELLVTTQLGSADAGNHRNPELLFALVQKLKFPLNEVDKQQVEQWLKAPNSIGYMMKQSKRRGQQFLIKIRYIDGTHVCGLYSFEFYEGLSDNSSSPRQVKEVKEIYIHPERGLDSHVIRDSVNSFIQEKFKT